MDESINFRIADSLKSWIDESVDMYHDIINHLKEIKDILECDLQFK